MSANDKQINGDHYRGAIQTWDYIVANDLGFLEGNIVKYVTRFRKKNGIQDLEKARHYLDKLIEVENERLQRTLYTNGSHQETVTDSATESQNRLSASTGSNAPYREQVTAELRVRTQTGYGQPQGIGDIT